ncbi:MAG: peptidoglycan DD-metalloendopeptidase family protein [Firmicutes bacterium]|nr:peptidoglycan DD-metalloendopeptidase family protein [Bacillota bacterium]
MGKHFVWIDKNLDNLNDRKKYFYHTDHLGSTVAVTDEEGQTVWASEYTPFGGKHSTEGMLAHAAKFTGKDLDEDIGLYYFNARWYDQEIGRFISEDPIKDGLNWYTYAVNNPLRYIDPSGLAYEDFEREAQTSSIWGDLISRVKNYYAGHGPITDSELRIRERNKLSEGIGKDPTATSAQASLVIMGYDLGASGPRKDGVDGDPGKKTEKAVMEFQQAVGLSPTGIIDAQTTAALDLAIRAGFKKADLEKIGETYKHYNLDWPTQSRNITSPFGTRIHPISKKERFHAGIDIGAVTAGVEGDRIVSAADGRVVLSANQPDGAGYYLVIESIYKGQKTQILYMHLQEGSIVVKQDDIVRAGQHIANMGNTGTSTAAHLHFEIRVFEGGEWVRKDPMSWNYNY